MDDIWSWQHVQLPGEEDKTMRRNRQPSEYNNLGWHIEMNNGDYSKQREQQHIRDLMEKGFTWEEAVKLVQMQEHLYENVEVRQRMEEDEYMLFARWLYKQGVLHEDVD